MSEVNSEYSNLPEGVRVGIGNGDLPCVFVETEKATAQVYFHGAHVAQFQPKGQNDVLWMSESGNFATNKPLRGGVPLVWPWFGPNAENPETPMHGFARLKTWKLVEAKTQDDGDVTLDFSLSSDDETLALWPHQFEAHYLVTISETLGLEFRVLNSGASAFKFEEALHTYFSVSDVREIEISGLSSTEYIDKTDNFAQKTEGNETIRITSETDRVYLDTQTTCIIHDEAGKRDIIVGKDNSSTTVVWNPWVAKSKAMPDFGDEEWPQMLCIETANVGEAAVTLAPGESHTMMARIAVKPRN